MNYKDISGEDIKKLQQDQPDTVVLDVRTPMEVSQGKIPGSQVIDVMDAQFPQKVEALDKDKPYVVYCRSGNSCCTGLQLYGRSGIYQTL